MQVALVGAGRQGFRRLQAIQDLGEDEVVIVADLDDTVARSLASRARSTWTRDWQEAVGAEVEVVVVCVPPDAHLDVTMTALNAGRHVLCEKPLALTTADAWKLVEASESTGRVLKCGFNYRHHPALLQAKAWVAEGRIGRPCVLRSRHGTGGRHGFEREWRIQRERSGGGVLMDQGIHVLDLFRWFGGAFTSVVGCTATCYWPVAPVEDNAFAVLCGDNLLASLHVSWTQWKPLFSFELIGTDGCVSIEGLGGGYGVERIVYQHRGTGSTREKEVIEYRGPDVSWQEEWREFKIAITQGRDPSGSCRDGAEALALVEAIYEASRGNCVVHLSGGVQALLQVSTRV